MKQTNKSKKVILLGLVSLLCIGLGYWALFKPKKKDTKDARGLNLTLPDANLKEKDPTNKLGFYDLAQKDSLKKEEWLRNDPYFKKDSLPANPYSNELEKMTESTVNKFNQRFNATPYEKNSDQPAEKLLERLKQLEKAIARNDPSSSNLPPTHSDAALQTQLDRLESLLQMSNANGTADPAMAQLEGTLDKILDIQHPQRVKERVNQERLESQKTVSQVLKTKHPDTLIKGFYGYSSESELKDPDMPSIEAVVHRDQSLTDGGIIQLRLVQDVYVNQKIIPAGTLVSGKVKLDGERLLVDILSIRNKKEFFPVKLAVYDMDGLPGIYIPGTINRETAKQSADNSLALLDFPSIDPNLKSKAIQAGVGAAKNLLSRKVKLVKVTVKANYSILLK